MGHFKYVTPMKGFFFKRSGFGQFAKLKRPEKTFNFFFFFSFSFKSLNSAFYLPMKDKKDRLVGLVVNMSDY